ncbi:MAG: hypothetical protein ABIG96_00905, partial [Candidatus Micrarchaeota archaeon]
LGGRYGFNTNITALYLNVTPYDSFNLIFYMLLFINSTDPEGTISIARTYNESYLLSIEGLDDLLYPLSTNGFVKRTISKAYFPVDNSSNVDIAVATEVYLSSVEGGSFMDRMEGEPLLQEKYSSMSPNAIGLEGFVNLQRLSQIGLTIKDNQSDLDFLYFSNMSVLGCNVQNSTYSWLKLDAGNATKYGVTVDSC